MFNTKDNIMKKIFILLTLSTLTIRVCGQNIEFNKFIESFAKKNNFNGTILIEQNTKKTYEKSFGFSNFPFKVPSTVDTKYKIASLTKAFTAVLTLQLVEEGKIDLNKTIKTYLPQYNGQGGNAVTIKELLNMTTGMRNMDDGLTLESALKNGIPQYQKPYTSDEMLIKFCNDTLVTKPGTVFDYNNADYIILGKIIEKLSGKTFDENLKEKILTPLQMYDTGLLSQHDIVEKLADTYFYFDDTKKLVNDFPVYIDNWFAAGAMYSTVEDILKFSEALFSNKLLKETTMNEMLTPGLGEYGYGVWIYKDYNIHGKMYTIVKRPGSIMGAQAMLLHILENGTTVIILCNTNTVNMDDLGADILDKITE